MCVIQYIHVIFCCLFAKLVKRPRYKSPLIIIIIIKMTTNNDRKSKCSGTHAQSTYNSKRENITITSSFNLSCEAENRSWFLKLVRTCKVQYILSSCRVSKLFLKVKHKKEENANTMVFITAGNASIMSPKCTLKLLKALCS